MRKLTVLYDQNCTLCCRARTWLEGEPKWVAIEFVPAASEEARRRYPALDHERTLSDLTAIADDSEVYFGVKGWLISLWALRGYREWALRAAGSTLAMATVRSFVHLVARNRYRFSEMLSP